MNKILLVEDDNSITLSLTEFLTNEGFKIIAAGTYNEALKIAGKETFDLALLDVSLPDGNGMFLCSRIKEYKIPVIFLTASGSENNVVQGFDMGADDYIAKPFRPRELLSRIKNILRRYGKNSSVVIVGELRIDTDQGTVYRNDRELLLSALEYRLLLVFINNRGRLLLRNQLLEELWDIAGDYVNDNTLTVYIKRLREKIETDPQKPEIIKTVRGMGYRLD